MNFSIVLMDHFDANKCKFTNTEWHVFFSEELSVDTSRDLTANDLNHHGSSPWIPLKGRLLFHFLNQLCCQISRQFLKIGSEEEKNDGFLSITHSIIKLKFLY